MELTKIGTKGQMVIPQRIRNKLEINAGSILAVGIMKDLVVIKKIDNDLETQFKKSLENVKIGKIKRVA